MTLHCVLALRGMFYGFSLMVWDYDPMMNETGVSQFRFWWGNYHDKPRTEERISLNSRYSERATLRWERRRLGVQTDGFTLQGPMVRFETGVTNGR